MSTLKTNRIENLSTTDGGISINNSGQVGIGTTSPGTVAHADADNLVVSDSGDCGITINSGTSSTGKLIFNDSNGTKRGGISYDHSTEQTHIYSNGDGDGIYLDSAGRLLLGTTTEGAASGDDLTVATSGNTGITIRSGTSSSGNLFFSDGTSGNDEIRGYVQYLHSSNALLFGANASEAMRIDSSGRVGIGVSSLSSSSRLTLLESTGNAQTLEIKGANSGGVGSQPGIKLTASNGDNIGGIYGDTNSDAVILQTGATERMRIDSSGNVGVNTTSPTQKIDAEGNILARDSGNTKGALLSNDGCLEVYRDTSNAFIDFKTNTSEDFDCRIQQESDGLAVSTGGNGSTFERMRIDSSGNLLIGTTNTNPAGQNTNGTAISSGGRISAQVSGDHHRLGRAQDGIIVAFHSAGGTEGTVSISGATTSYNTSSDYRLKENVVDIADGITRVKQLQPRRFNFIAHASKTVDGFLAHEAQTVVPEAVTGTHNQVDDEGNAVMQGIDQSKLVPLLTAALQEAIAKIETLEVEVAALKSN